MKKMILVLLAMVTMTMGIWASAAPAEPQETLDRMIELLEPMALGEVFADMDAARLAEVTAPIAKYYDFVGRVSDSGRYAYVVGMAKGESPIRGMMPEVGYVGEVAEATPFVLKGDGKSVELPEARRVVGAAEDMKYIYIDAARDLPGLKLTFDRVFAEIIKYPEARELAADMASRGTSTIQPLGRKYAEVWLFDAPDAPLKHGGWPEYFLLTDEDIANCEADIKAGRTLGEYMGMCFTATDELVGDDSGNVAPAHIYEVMPESLRALAVEKCNYVTAKALPASELTKATMELYNQNGTVEKTQVVEDAERLKALIESLQHTKTIRAPKSAFNVKVVMNFADGTEYVLYKASSGDDTLVVGSYSFHEIGEKNNEEFWKVFDEIEPMLPY